jgi:uncharacterized membrane protein YqjE
VEETPPASARVLSVLRRMAETLLSTAQNRVELLSVELQEEKYWLVSTLLSGAAAVFFGGLAIIFGVATIVYIVPDGARPWVLGAFSVLFLFLTIQATMALRRSLRDKPPPLSDTVGELKKDIEWMRSQD